MDLLFRVDTHRSWTWRGRPGVEGRDGRKGAVPRKDRHHKAHPG